jgi:parvulin-like peptidyl-prolyl isomerase
VKSYKTVILLSIVALLLASCGTIKNELGLSSKPGITYNELSESEKNIDNDLKAIASNEVLVETLSEGEQPLVEDGKVTDAYRASWANIQLRILAFREARIDADMEITDEDREQAEEQVKSLFAQAGTEEADQIWEGFDDDFKERLIEGYAEQYALLRSAPEVTDEEAKEYFEENKAAFTECASGKSVSHILVDELEEAESIKADLDDGGDFEKIAKEKSQDPGTKDKGGDLGCLAEGQYVAEFETAANALALGEISDPVQTEYGYHIITVNEFVAPTYEELEDQIKEALAPTKQEAIYTDLEERLKKAKVEVLEKYGKVIKQEGIPTVVTLDTEETPETSTPAPVPEESSTSVPTS